MWNWNITPVSADISIVAQGLIIPMWNWNVYHKIKPILVSGIGLIIPMWNWNFYFAGITAPGGPGLIIPMWNWNNCGGGYNITIPWGINHTNVELKSNYIERLFHEASVD